MDLPGFEIGTSVPLDNVVIDICLQRDSFLVFLLDPAGVGG